VEQEYLHTLVARWREGFDWPERQKDTQPPPQFLVDIDGRMVHFLRIHGLPATDQPPDRPAVPRQRSVRRSPTVLGSAPKERGSPRGECSTTKERIPTPAAVALFDHAAKTY
jgi:hypothetical protein